MLFRQTDRSPETRFRIRLLQFYQFMLEPVREGYAIRLRHFAYSDQRWDFAEQSIDLHFLSLGHFQFDELFISKVYAFATWFQFHVCSIGQLFIHNNPSNHPEI